MILGLESSKKNLPQGAKDTSSTYLSCSTIVQTKLIYILRIFYLSLTGFSFLLSLVYIGNLIIYSFCKLFLLTKVNWNESTFAIYQGNMCIKHDLATRVVLVTQWGVTGVPIQFRWSKTLEFYSFFLK